MLSQNFSHVAIFNCKSQNKILILNLYRAAINNLLEAALANGDSPLHLTKNLLCHLFMLSTLITSTGYGL